MQLTFYQSTDLNQPFRVKICYLEGFRERLPYSELIKDPSKSLSLLGSRNPVSLVVSAQIFIEAKPITIPVYTPYKPPSGGQVTQHKWNEWLELPIDISHLAQDSQLALTIWGPSGNSEYEVYGGTTLSLFSTSMGTLCQGRQKLKVWLDKQADGSPTTTTPAFVKPESDMDRFERLIKLHQTGEIKSVDWLDNMVFRKIEKLNRENLLKDPKMHNLYVELPIYDFDVVHNDYHYTHAVPTVSNTQQLSTPVAVFEENSAPPIAVSYDPDLSKETPIEAKFRRLIRSATDGKEIRANAKQRDDLTRIMAYSPVRELTSDEKNLVWRFRYYLSRHKLTLTKFVKSVTWDDTNEALKAIEVINNWTEIDVAEALELLGPDVENPDVRAYAVRRLRTASDKDLELYLMQLVEALKFESYRESPSASALAKLLINRSVQNSLLGNYFYWYMYVQSQERDYGKRIYEPILTKYLDTLARTNSGDQLSLQLRFQVKLINKLLELAKYVKSLKDSRPKRIQAMRDYISDPRNELDSFLPTILPLNPTVTAVGCVPEKCTVFKSTMQPLKLTFRQQGGGEYSFIFKSGDDLRQDQLVMQIIMLMDKLLRDENLDLKLYPYSILATSTSDGAIQFIVNQPLSDVLSEYHGILPFLKKYNADPTQPLGVSETAMDNFVRSSAGYAVITYLLGVGDRHLDNLLISPDGRFFHIDFGYILGQDPKPFPPMIKLPIQLIDGMGGINSENYNRFKSYCFTAFITLRRSSNLILALFNLMSESSIPTLMRERHHAVLKVEERFCLDMSEEQAISHFQNLINDSVNAFLPVVIDRLHSLAQYWRA